MKLTEQIVKEAMTKMPFKSPYSPSEWLEHLYLENYHCHKDFSNVAVTDCAESIENYAKRIKELGSGQCLYSGEHGSQGNQFHVYKVAEQYGLKYRHSAEVYWVKDRHSKDRANCHMMIVAKNPEGRKDLNYILSIANEDGYYYQPRIDLELLFSVNPENFIVTSACFTAGNRVLTKDGYKNIEDIRAGDLVKNKFGEWEKVNYPTSRFYKGTGYEITIQGVESPIICTEDHKFLTTSISDIGNKVDLPRWKTAEDLYLGQAKGRKIKPILLKPINPEFKRICVIDKKDWAYSITKKSSQNPRKILLPDAIKITPEICMFIGAMVGNGSISIKSNPIIDLVINEQYYEMCLNEFIKPVETQLNMKFRVRKEGKVYWLSNNAKDFVEFIYFLMGDCKAVNKKIPDCLLNISDKHNKALIYGLVMTDGCLSTHKGGWENRPYMTGRLNYSTISKTLKDQIIELFDQCLLKTTWRVAPPSSKTPFIKSSHDHYEIQVSNKCFANLKKGEITFHDFEKIITNIYKDNHFSLYITLDGIVYKKQKIKGIKKVDIEHQVYCLNNNSHSFLVNEVIAHNCLAGHKYEDSDEVWLSIANHFKGNFFFEVQPHNIQAQKILNQHLLELSDKYHVPLICGLDSHYVLEENRIKREIMQKDKGISYDSNEIGFDMDYPDTMTVIERFEKQGVLNQKQILEAILNTNVFVNECEEITFNREFKIPNIYKNLDYEGRVKLFKEKINEKYKKDPYKSKEKIQGIRWEVEQFVESKTVDYPLFSEAMVKVAVEEFGGVITRTARGSSSSFLTNNYMGLTTIDRFTSDVPLFPERFLTKERVLANQLPDIDNNLADQEPFIKAIRKLLGEHGCYPLMTRSTYKEKSAWLMYARVNGIEAEKSFAVSKALDQYNKDLRYVDDEDKDQIHVEDYIPVEYKELYEESKSYQGITIAGGVHPCGFLCFDGDIRREIGLISAKSETTGERTLVACVEGQHLDEFGYVKEDLLIVDAVSLTKEMFDSIGKPVPSFEELKKMVNGDKPTWDIYKNGITCCVNQMEKEATTQKGMKYAPQNIAELCAFIAAIRPSFASLLNNFINRKPYTTGEEKIDQILESSSHYMLYQESIMSVLSFLGLPIGETYTVIKSISKKKLKGEKKETLLKELRESWLKEFGNLDNFDKVWKVIEDAAAYAFNSSHSYAMAGDSLYLAWFKAHYPAKFYEVAINHYQKKGNKNKIDSLIKEAMKFYGYKIGAYEFGTDNRQVNIQEEEKIIYPNLSAVKGFGEKVVEQLYEVGQGEFEDFSNVYESLLKTALNKTQMTNLAKLGYFSKYGNENQILALIKLYNFMSDMRSSVSKKKLEENSIPLELVLPFGRETKTRIMDLDKDALLKVLESQVHEDEPTDYQKLYWQWKITGIADKQFPIPQNEMFVTKVQSSKGNSRIRLYSPSRGKTAELKVQAKKFEMVPLEEGNFIRLDEIKRQIKREFTGKVLENGKREYLPVKSGETEPWASNYTVLDKVED